MSEVKPYYFVRFRWIKGIDVQAIYHEFRSHFDIQLRTSTEGIEERSPFSEAERIRVTADTLTARLSPFRAILFQKEALPFTPKDLKLREKIFELYPRRSPTVFGQWKKEPPFTTSESKD